MGVNESLKFLSKYLAVVPKSNPKSKRTQDRLHERTGGWVPPVMTTEYFETIENQRKQAHDGTRKISTHWTGADSLRSRPGLSAGPLPDCLAFKL